MCLLLTCMIRDHPRLRGEHFQHLFLLLPVAGSSPLTRGAHHPPFYAVYLHGIIPAYAGSTCRPPSLPACGRDHPRLRGEHVYDVRPLVCRLGSSPLTRGAPRLGVANPMRRRIIPAYAGSTMLLQKSYRSTRDHPRLRGEHCSLALGLVLGLGSSPLTRGARPSINPGAARSRIIPAYAGSTIRMQ